MTRHEIINKIAVAIDPLAFAPGADPHRFANAFIAAENAIVTLAECDLSENVTDEVLDAYNAVATSPFNMLKGFAAGFSVMLRSIANEDTRPDDQ